MMDIRNKTWLERIWLVWWKDFISGVAKILTTVLTKERGGGVHILLAISLTELLNCVDKVAAERQNSYMDRP